MSSLDFNVRRLTPAVVGAGIAFMSAPPNMSLGWKIAGSAVTGIATGLGVWGGDIASEAILPSPSQINSGATLAALFFGSAALMVSGGVIAYEAAHHVVIDSLPTIQKQVSPHAKRPVTFHQTGQRVIATLNRD